MPHTESQPFSPWVPPRFSAQEFSSQHLLGSTQTIVRGCGSSYKEKAREDKWSGFKGSLMLFSKNYPSNIGRSIICSSKSDILGRQMNDPGFSGIGSH
ncbi:hypothetical protein E2320_014465 [Naja naja]|nr:hypothetical protein E2320_014465 [Naja naja]